MTATQTVPDGQTHVELVPLFLFASTRNIKSQAIFKLNSLNHIFVKAGLYRAQSRLTQCDICQLYPCLGQLQATRSIFVVRRGHLHTESTLSWCNCTLGRETLHPASFRGWSHAKGELQRRKAQRAPKGEEADKVGHDFSASIASAYRLLTSKITLSDLNKDLPGLESLPKHKWRLKKLWQIPEIQHAKRQLIASPKPSDEWSVVRHSNGGNQN
jgi:hypothetical protein